MQKFLLVTFIALFCNGLWAQKWGHVGPLSTNLQPVNGQPNLFETGQINLIEVNPLNDQHLFCGGRCAGLWESTDGGANWSPIETNVLGTHGIGSILFLNKSEVFVSNHHIIVGGIKINSSKFSGIYDFNKKTWSVLSPVVELPHLIYDAAYALNVSGELSLMVGTDKGLFVSFDKGKQWHKMFDFAVFSIKKLIIEDKDAGFLFGAKQSLTEAPLAVFLRRDDFINSNYNKAVQKVLPVYNDSMITRRNQRILSVKAVDCVVEIGEVRSAEDFDVFVLSDQEVLYSETVGDKTKQGSTPHLLLQKLNVILSNFCDAQVMDHDTNLGRSILFGARTGLAYDLENRGIWYSGVKLHFAFDPSYADKKFRSVRQGFKTGKGIIHDDIHELRIYHSGGKRFLIAACDGGVGRSEIKPFDVQLKHPNEALYFENINNGLHVMLVNGFSGASLDPDLYVVGGFDIINTDFFRADLGRNEHTEPTWENAGGLIDKFDNSRALIDVSLYDHHYRYVQIDSNRNYRVSKNRSFYLPIAPGQPPIRVDSTKLMHSHEATNNFQRRVFVQDPFRPGRIFFVKHNVGLHQLDTASGFFVKKLELSEMNPGSELAGWSHEWRSWKSVSFSPNTPNSMHIIINGTKDEHHRIQSPMIIKYVGKDLDACFGHEHIRHGKGGAQWKLISWPLFNRFNKIMGCKLKRSEIDEVDLIDIETSVQDENQLYLLMRTKLNSKVKIVHFDGQRWRNYGQGLPEDEYALAMIMDYTSEDGIYMATDKGIYYRDRTMGSWIDYSGNYPKLNCEQLEINYLERTLRAGTFGWGIWKTPLFGAPEE